MTTVRLATRGSDLALTQSRSVAARIETELGVRVELVTLKTTGDRIQNVSLAKIGGKGLFVKEIEEALLDGRADLAVHSAKDLPAQVPEGLEFVAYPERADPRDALAGRERGATLEGLPRGARVGTGSVRRIAELKAQRPDLEVVPLRGNVPTRLRKLEEEGLDAVILACAGLDRLGLSDRIDERISSDVLLPAVAQGILAIEGRSGDPFARDVAALAEEAAAGRLRLRALLTSLDGRRVLRHECAYPAAEAARAGAAAAEAILGNGGEALLAELRAEAGA